MNELVFIQYVFYLLGIFAVIKIFIIELEDVIVRFKKFMGKIRKNSHKE